MYMPEYMYYKFNIENWVGPLTTVVLLPSASGNRSVIRSEHLFSDPANNGIPWHSTFMQRSTETRKSEAYLRYSTLTKTVRYHGVRFYLLKKSRPTSTDVLKCSYAFIENDIFLFWSYFICSSGTPWMNLLVGRNNPPAPQLVVSCPNFSEIIFTLAVGRSFCILRAVDTPMMPPPTTAMLYIVLCMFAVGKFQYHNS